MQLLPNALVLRDFFIVIVHQTMPFGAPALQSREFPIQEFTEKDGLFANSLSEYFKVTLVNLKAIGNSSRARNVRELSMNETVVSQTSRHYLELAVGDHESIHLQNLECQDGREEQSVAGDEQTGIWIQDCSVRARMQREEQQDALIGWREYQKRMERRQNGIKGAS